MSMFVDRGAHRISALLSFYSQDELEEAGARAAELEREPELGFTSVFTRPLGFNINAQVALVIATAEDRNPEKKLPRCDFFLLYASLSG